MENPEHHTKMTFGLIMRPGILRFEVPKSKVESRIRNQGENDLDPNELQATAAFFLLPNILANPPSSLVSTPPPPAIERRCGPFIGGGGVFFKKSARSVVAVRCAARLDTGSRGWYEIC